MYCLGYTAAPVIPHVLLSIIAADVINPGIPPVKDFPVLAWVGRESGPGLPKVVTVLRHLLRAREGSRMTESGINWIVPGGPGLQEPMFWIPAEEAGFLTFTGVDEREDAERAEMTTLSPLRVTPE